MSIKNTLEAKETRRKTKTDRTKSCVNKTKLRTCPFCKDIKGRPLRFVANREGKREHGKCFLKVGVIL